MSWRYFKRADGYIYRTNEKGDVYCKHDSGWDELVWKIDEIMRYKDSYIELTEKEVFLEVL